jgi:hypothetical protein
MATEQPQTVRLDTAVDNDAIAATVQMYIDGSAQGDTAMLSAAFHPDAQMYGAVGDHRYDEPITSTSSCGGFTRRRDDARGDHLAGSGRRRGRRNRRRGGILGTLSFVTFLALARIDGRWRNRARRLQRQLEALGYAVTLDQTEQAEQPA